MISVRSLIFIFQLIDALPRQLFCCGQREEVVLLLSELSREGVEHVRTIQRPAARAVMIAIGLTVGIGGVAHARTGFDSNPKSVVFYYGETAGSGANSQNFAGYGNVKLCMGSSTAGGGNTYVGRYLWNRTLQPDDVMRDANVAYNAGSYQSSAFFTPSDRTYHTEASWSAVPAAPNDVSGFVATRTASLSCP